MLWCLHVLLMFSAAVCGQESQQGQGSRKLKRQSHAPHMSGSGPGDVTVRHHVLTTSDSSRVSAVTPAPSDSQRPNSVLLETNVKRWVYLIIRTFTWPTHFKNVIGELMFHKLPCNHDMKKFLLVTSNLTKHAQIVSWFDVSSVAIKFYFVVIHC